MTEPSSTPAAKVDVLAIAALIVGVVSIFFNPFVLVSVIAIVLGVIALVNANRSVRAGGPGTYRFIAILAIVAGAIGAILVIVGNSISSLA
jgi:predicted PurR-regulated permease PerM